jgi:protein-S-isoprenylcysteine O-methyltransferase Ste14
MLSGVGRVVSVEPIFVVSDVARAVAHYEQLGFSASRHDEGYAFAHRNELTIHLAGPGAFPERVGRGTIYMHVDDADALAEEWRGAGVDFVEPQDLEWGKREGSHKDPDGNLIRFGSPLRRYAPSAARVWLKFPFTLNASDAPPNRRSIVSVDPPALGRRGEGWVVFQSIVIVATVACAIDGPRWPHGVEPWLRVGGFVLEAAGAGMLILSRITLGRSFTPLPRPRDRSTLRNTGIYARARHPLYGGILVFGLGLSFHRSPLVLAPTAVLAVIFWLKSIREEAWLAERYLEYTAYRRSTPRRFIPWII